MSNICQNCKQARATVHVTVIDAETNQPPQERHLCESCARDTGATSSFHAQPLATVATVAALATSALTGALEKPEGRRSARKASCGTCGMSYQEFRSKGRFGCAACYDSFEDGLIPLLEKVHGASQYLGNYPRGATLTDRSQQALEQELTDLRLRLSRVIKSEDYEEAARVRDRIQELERLLAGPATP